MTTITAHISHLIGRQVEIRLNDGRTLVGVPQETCSLPFFGASAVIHQDQEPHDYYLRLECVAWVREMEGV